MRGANRRGLLRGAGTVVLAAACTPAPSDAPAQGSGGDVELFAEGAVSTAAPEFATAFSASGDTVFFNRTSQDRSRIELMFSVRTGDGWNEAEAFPPLAGVLAIDPFVSLDGRRLYFSADLSIEGLADGSFNVWVGELADSVAAPRPLPPPINTDSSDVFNALAADGTMVFSSRRSGARRVFETRVSGNGWADPVLLELGGGEASNPTIHPDGRLLVFARRGIEGTPDLHVACRSGADWSEPVRLPEPVNSPFTEFAPAIAAEYLYFTSERPGVVGSVPESERPPGDIYRTPIATIEAYCRQR